MLRLALLFHINQHLSEMARLGATVCYTDLLRTFRQHRDLPINVHIAGTLVRALQWLDNEPLDLIRQGIDDGQFLLIGSTYAQNVPYATDDWDNSKQIALHRRVLQAAFNAQPDVFWNPERCWRQSLSPVITAGGYRTTLVEDHILAAAGARPGRVYTTGTRQSPLNLVYDDETFKHHFNYAAWFGDSSGLHRHLDKMIAQGAELLAYAEDGEAMGLWGWSVGLDPRPTFPRLGALLEELAARPDVELAHLDALPEPAGHLDHLPDGAAAWMNANLLRADAPYHEDGYSDWFDFNQNAPKLRTYRKLFASLRPALQVPPPAAQPGAVALHDLALQAFLNGQFEFGCIGIGGPKVRYWRVAEHARTLLRLAREATRPQPPAWREITVADLNGDGRDEYLFRQGQQVLVLTPVGGRLLYWADLSTGRLWVCNPLAVVWGDWHGESVPPDAEDYPDEWLPGPDKPATPLVDDPVPTRMARFLPEWAFEGQTQPHRLPLLSERKSNTRHTAINAQQGAFYDVVTIGDVTHDLRKREFAARVQHGQVVFDLDITAELRLEKRITLTSLGPNVTFTLTNTGTVQLTLSLTSLSELAFDYAAILARGWRACETTTVDGCLAVRGAGQPGSLLLSSNQPRSADLQHEALLGQVVGYRYNLTLEPGGSTHRTLALVPRP